MARIITDTSEPLEANQTYWLYNGLDSCITYEVWQNIRQFLDPDQIDRKDKHPDLIRDEIIERKCYSRIYRFERAQRSAALEIMINGMYIDPVVRENLLDAYSDEYEKVYEALQIFVNIIWDKGLNPNSPKQCIDFFYNRMNLPEQKIWDSKKRRMRLTTNRDALEKLKIFFVANPIINCIIALRDIGDKISVIKSKVDTDGRMRASYNVGATDTGRWSSSENVFRRGTNLQNIYNEHRPHMGHRAIRRMFVPSPGKKYGNADLAQAESRIIAYLAEDEEYIKAHETGDPHTMVAGMCFDLDFNGDLEHDKTLAKEPYYRQFSYRDMAKRAGHLSNYGGSARKVSEVLKVPLDVAREFQFNYFSKFPGIRKYHNKVAYQLQTAQTLITPLGRVRHFFGRPDADDTLRKAIAYVPQSVVADILNIGLIRVHRLRIVKIVNQGHDSILFEFNKGTDEDIIPKIIETMLIPFTINGRRVVIPVDAETGWNWHDLHSWKKNVDAVRPPQSTLLDKVIKWQPKEKRRVGLEVSSG